MPFSNQINENKLKAYLEMVLDQQSKAKVPSQKG